MKFVKHYGNEDNTIDYIESYDHSVYRYYSNVDEWYIVNNGKEIKLIGYTLELVRFARIEYIGKITGFAKL
jgi:hypothetical protein